MHFKKRRIEDQNPVNRDRVATTGRTTSPQRTDILLPSDQFNFTTGDNPTAAEAASLVIE